MNPVSLFLDNLAFVRDELTSASKELGLSVRHMPLQAITNDKEPAISGPIRVAVISTTPALVRNVFAVLRKLQSLDIPRICIQPLTRLQASVELDFKDSGCVVLPLIPTRDQFLQALAVADAAEQRAARRGVTIRLNGKADPLVVGPHGGEQPYKLGTGRQRPTFFRLAASPGVVIGPEELSGGDFEPGQVKIYIERLRDRYEPIRRALRLKISRFDFIEEVAGKYRLNAKIKRPQWPL